MSMREAIVLAGGLGTRLRSAVPDLPKCMAPVNGRPFLSYLLDYFQSQGIRRYIFSVGYRHEVIVDFIRDQYKALDAVFSIEQEPLGTGGGIFLSMQQAREAQVLVLNGDTFFRVDVETLSAFHVEKEAECTLALKSMSGFDRYGVVETDDSGCIRDFLEKKPYKQGLINGGVYAIQRDRFLQRNYPAVFSFEMEYLEQVVTEGCLYGQVQEGYFIDIGIPEDYKKAQADFTRFDRL